MGSPTFTSAPPVDDEVAALNRRRERENAVIEAGDDVFSHDGEVLGTIHSVTVDTETDRPVRLVIRHGMIFTKHVALSADAIESIDDGEVTLNLTKAQFEVLPPIVRP